MTVWLVHDGWLCTVCAFCEIIREYGNIDQLFDFFEAISYYCSEGSGGTFSPL